MNLCGVAKAAVCSAVQYLTAKEHQRVTFRKGRHRYLKGWCHEMNILLRVQLLSGDRLHNVIQFLLAIMELLTNSENPSGTSNPL